MQKRKIGSLEVSSVGLGTNNFGTCLDLKASALVIDAALEAGINFIDTADVYGRTRSEKFIGQSLGKRRDDVVLATKFGMHLDEEHRGGARPAYVKACVEDSLRRLATDRIDLFILHRYDSATPLGDTLGALDELVQVGKVREIGCSNFSVAQLKEATASTAPGAARFVNLQNQFSLLDRTPEAGVIEECERTGIGFVPYTPLGRGLLTGKYLEGKKAPDGTRIALMDADRRDEVLNDRDLSIVSQLNDFSVERGKTLLELAFSWLLTHKAVASVIAGASSPEQIKANVAAADWELSDDELAEVHRLAPVS